MGSEFKSGHVPNHMNVPLTWTLAWSRERVLELVIRHQLPALDHAQNEVRVVPEQLRNVHTRQQAPSILEGPGFRVQGSGQGPCTCTEARRAGVHSTGRYSARRAGVLSTGGVIARRAGSTAQGG